MPAGGTRGRGMQSAEKSEQEREKNRSPERKDYIGDFGFRVSSGPKPISPIFRLSDESREPALELDVHCTRRETRPHPFAPPSRDPTVPAPARLRDVAY